MTWNYTCCLFKFQRAFETDKYFDTESEMLMKTPELQQSSSKDLEKHSVKSFLKVGNLYSPSTTQGLDQASSGPPQTNKLHNAMPCKLAFHLP